MPNIYLVGFMGAGKSLVGRAVAARSRRRFIDLDSHLEERFEMPISEVFRHHGEPVFRRAERDALSWAARLDDDAVVATGGGAFCDDDNREMIHGRGGRSVFLDVPWTVIAGRLEQEHGNRPVFRSLEQAEQLWRARRPHYEKATWTLDLTGAESPDEIADAVLSRESGVPCAT
jgi:shikimate kinase